MAEEEKSEEKADVAEVKKPEGQVKRKRHTQSQKWLHYDIENKSRKRKTCPKCGSGVFLAQHENRLYCGKCSYTEFAKKELKPDVGVPDKPEAEETEK